MGNIWPYGRPKGRNHVGIYLFETISEQVESWKPERVATLPPQRTAQHATFCLPHNENPSRTSAHTTTLSANRAWRYRPKLLHGTTTQLFAGIRKTIPLPFIQESANALQRG